MSEEDSGRLGDDLTDLEDREKRKVKTALRCRYLERGFNALSADWMKKTNVPFHINKFYLLSAVRSYIRDIRNLKQSHGIERADRFKVASYTMLWIAKIRPVYVRNEDFKSPVPAEEVVCMMANAGFAYAAGCDMAGINMQAADSEDPEFTKRIIHHLHHSNIEPGITAHFMKLAANLWPADKVVS